MAAIGDALNHGDVWSTYRLLEIANRHLVDIQALEPLLDVARSRHGEVADVMRPCLAEARRQANIKLRRDQIRDADHRFFLALLLNLPNRPAILQLVEKRYPGLDPVAWVVEQIGALAAADRIGLKFDDVSLAALEGMLRHETDDGAARALVARYGERAVHGKRAALAGLFAEIRSALLLQPLFA
jgi:hypothetical protein